MIGAIVIVLAAVFGLLWHRQLRSNYWHCDICGGKRDFFETPWLDKRGLVGGCCLGEVLRASREETIQAVKDRGKP